jgi:hypothetical protein
VTWLSTVCTSCEMATSFKDTTGAEEKFITLVKLLAFSP